MLNRCVLQGRIVQNPELKTTGSGASVCNFTLAVERDVPDRNGNRGTDFIDFVAWRKTAEFVHNYCMKGSMVIAEGRLQMRDYTDRSGNKRRAAEIEAERVYFSESARREEERHDDPFSDLGSADDDDIPF